MAFAVASKAAPSAGLLKNLRRLATPSSSLLAPASSVAGTRRLFHRNYYYYAAPSVGNQLVLYHHQLLAPHFFHPMFFAPAAPPRIWLVSSKEVEDDAEVTVAMPGLPKERVTVRTNRKDLFVGVKGTDDAVVQDPAPYSCHVEFPSGEFDLGKAKAEMKHGLLKVTVPRVKGIEIKIE